MKISISIHFWCLSNFAKVNTASEKKNRANTFMNVVGGLYRLVLQVNKNLMSWR